MGATGGLNRLDEGSLRKGEPEVSWFSRIQELVRPSPRARAGSRDDPEATEEFATLSSFTLLPGQLKLRVGVVSVRGNYREHNEDNFYVPGPAVGPARQQLGQPGRTWPR